MTRLLPPVNGYASPTIFRAALAFAVNTTVYSDGARKWERTAWRASSAHLKDSFELLPSTSPFQMISKRIYLPIADGMCVTHNTMVEKFRVGSNQALWI